MYMYIIIVVGHLAFGLWLYIFLPETETARFVASLHFLNTLLALYFSCTALTVATTSKYSHYRWCECDRLEQYLQY
jgi:hypothetical protein